MANINSESVFALSKVKSGKFYGRDDDKTLRSTLALTISRVWSYGRIHSSRFSQNLALVVRNGSTLLLNGNNCIGVGQGKLHFMKKIIVLAAILLSLSATAQRNTSNPKYQIHETSKTKTIQVSNVLSAKLNDFSDGHMVVWINGTAHIFDQQGNKTGETTSNNIEIVFSDGVARISRTTGNKTKYSIIDYNGNEIASFDERYSLSKFVDGIAYLYNPLEGVRVINRKGEQILSENDITVSKNLVSTEHTDPFPLVEGRRFYYDKTNDLLGLMNENGAIVKKGTYYSVSSFSEGLCAVSIKNGNEILWGYIDKNGEMVIPNVYSNKPGDFREGFAIATKKNGKRVFIDSSGKVVSEEFSYAAPFTEGKAIVISSSGRCSLVDKSFKEIKQLPEDYLGFTIKRYAYRPELFSPKNGTFWYTYNNSGESGRTYSSTGEYVIDLTAQFKDEITWFVRADRRNNKAPFAGYVNLEGEIILKIVESEF